ncbi:ATP-binding cassette domain-containing protein [Alicyclobacillus dauci]|uniref:ABC transporter ATP-binding protein n=1 Tax=Alicyclobacillus dauci TaxID=1475485 RepID=A0ABY6Z7E6_9BACL|nr:ABC transporter ATP-binding protein [Alicyclobacillus dauci]WAH38448.1 ABC transporter ATP-binding protein [Alicyclobacillus dauci]
MNDSVTMAVCCTGVQVRIGRKAVLHDITFGIEPGQIAGLLGPNGAGKSTLLSLISGIAPVETGKIEIFGQEAGEKTLTQTAYLPDRGKLPSWLRVGEWLAFAQKLYPDWDVDRARYLREALNVQLDAKISSLSRGEEARLQLMTCLSRSVPLVLLDEPFVGVDLTSRERIAETVVREMADGSRTFLIATHDIREMDQMFDRIVLIDKGSIVSVDDTDALRSRGMSVETRYREVFT